MRVAICIPAYEAACFIERTLDCAAAQTLSDVRILVSIDVSKDTTEAICRERAAADDRIEVVAQPSRLGWAGNVNYVLDHAGGELSFIYFHDDLIEPTYCERLAGALDARPEAASAHCSMGHFGGGENVVESRPFEGSGPERLLDFLTARRTPSLLRSMMRTEECRAVRLPTGAGGVWGNQAFQMRLVAAGPAVAVDETLYRRWEGREGGLTDGWRSLPFADIVAGYRENTVRALELIDSLGASAEERRALVFGLGVYMGLRLRQAEERYGEEPLNELAVLSPELASLGSPDELSGLPPALAEQCAAAWARLERRTERRAAGAGR